jgi:hypothetical protein
MDDRRGLTDVEYLPFGVIPDRIHAFLMLYVNRHSGLSFCKHRTSSSITSANLRGSVLGLTEIADARE